MKINHNGKRYDTEKCQELGSYDLRSYSNNYAGTRHLLLASDGTLIIHQTSNGQDCHITSEDYVISRTDAIQELNGMSENMDDEQTAAAVKAGLIEEVP
jgi:hypothetical protein